MSKKNVQNEYNGVKLMKFSNPLKHKYSSNTLWVIFSCINSSFIDRFGLNLKGLPRLKKFLKQQTNKYIAEKSATFSAEEIHQVLLHLQEQNMPHAMLYGVAIALLYYGLLRANEVQELQVKDVMMLNATVKEEIVVSFNPKRKKEMRVSN